MRANHRSSATARPGGATTYQAIIDAERNPELFSNAGGIRPGQPAMPYMIDMDDPDICCGANWSTRGSPASG